MARLGLADPRPLNHGAERQMRLQKLWQWLRGGSPDADKLALPTPPQPTSQQTILPLDISPADPLLAYFQSEPGVVEIEKLKLDSPALRELKASNIQLVAPLVSQGQLIGLLNLGPRMSEQEYSSDDFRMLNNLASQAAPAVRVAQLVQQQQLEARQLERMEQELRVARIVQETLLPRDLPALQGWRLAAYWQPAQAIGGDFYDFIGLPDGQIGIVIADVTDKGVPAALVMASTRSMLRAAAERFTTPGQVLERVNNLLCPEIPAKMFVTCMYAIFNPISGRFWFANAGHNLPSQRSASGVRELRARGMPLGLLPDMTYEEVETVLEPGHTILLYSDGLVEAHNAQRDMFGFARLHDWLGAQPSESDGEQIVEHLKAELAAFTGPDWVQEDDVTLVLLEHLASPAPEQAPEEPALRTLAEFRIPSLPGNERQAMEQVLAVVTREMALPTRNLERLKTAVAEATMNAIEHGNGFRSELSAEIAVLTSPEQLVIRITDHGGGKPIPAVKEPDLQAKLDGLQSPRGWGLFLIKNMVDEMRVSSDDAHHTIELVFQR
jgi:serine phosphatase RsbU (regulator of sigma subunit)/anti-sigma regulatory factor (Ser/Thr protein kinase)